MDDTVSLVTAQTGVQSGKIQFDGGWSEGPNEANVVGQFIEEEGPPGRETAPDLMGARLRLPASRVNGLVGLCVDDADRVHVRGKCVSDKACSLKIFDHQRGHFSEWTWANNAKSHRSEPCSADVAG